MKKVKFISLALLLAFALMGAAFAAWSENISIGSTVETGIYDVVFSNAAGDIVSNDPEGMVDPGQQPAANVATTTAGITQGSNGKSLTIEVDNGYPGYNAEVTYKVYNNGTIPIKVTGAVVAIPGEMTGKITAVASQPTAADQVVAPGGTWTGTVTHTVTDAAAEDTDYSYSISVNTTQWNQ